MYLLLFTKFCYLITEHREMWKEKNAEKELKEKYRHF